MFHMGRRKPKRVRIELTETHQKALGYALNAHSIDLMPIGRTFLEEGCLEWSAIGRNEVSADGIYVMFSPLYLGRGDDEFEFNLSQLCSWLVEGLVPFVGLESDKKLISGLFAKKSWPLSEEHRRHYEQFFPLGKGESFDRAIKRYDRRYRVVALRESRVIDTWNGDYFFTPLDM
jgi:hypothetical protein